MGVPFVTGESLRAGIQRLIDLGLCFAVVVGDAMGSGERCDCEYGDCGQECFFHKKELFEYASVLQESNQKCKWLAIVNPSAVLGVWGEEL